MGKKDKLPKGVGRVPEWWMEVTPHNVLHIEDDEARRWAEEQEKKKFEKLAAAQDMLEKWGGEGFPDWNPATNGPRTTEEETLWTSKGYKRNEKEEWVDETGAPLEGRQFKGVLPPGYLPGHFMKLDDVDESTHEVTGLNAAKYSRDDGKGWEQPAWMKLKLRSTKDGGAIRQGDYSAEGKVITKGSDMPKAETEAEPETPVPEEPEEPEEPQAAPEEEVKEEAPPAVTPEPAPETTEEAPKTEAPRSPLKHTTTPVKVSTDPDDVSGLPPELQAIMKRRREAEQKAMEDGNDGVNMPSSPTKGKAQDSKLAPELQKIMQRRREAEEKALAEGEPSA